MDGIDCLNTVNDLLCLFSGMIFRLVHFYCYLFPCINNHLPVLLSLIVRAVSRIIVYLVLLLGPLTCLPEGEVY